MVITGASGYIGRHLAEMANDRGFEVIVLGSPPSKEFRSRSFSWRLGDRPSPEAFAGATALPSLPPKYPTLAIMANADRIGRHLATEARNRVAQ